MSTKGDIMAALEARLATITQQNGYEVDVKKVYADKIPMGIRLEPHELPAIFLLDGPETIVLEHQVHAGNWDIRLQLWDQGEKGDRDMNTFCRAVFKAIYADSPTAQRHDAFRALNPKVWQVTPLSVAPDLNLIDANRVTELAFSVQYRTKLWDL